jgi:uncharacterized protein YjbI with pentapeptide repeats
VADEEHIRRLQQGAEAWNTWRRDILWRGDLSHADLRGANLNEADLHGTYLRGANLGDAHLGGANLRGANLRGAFLSRANLSDANMSGANMSDANLSEASLIYADLWRANLKGANLTTAKLGETALAGVTLIGVIGLETCIHRGPSMIDHRTLQKSGPLPIQFLRGVGLPDRLIDYLPSLLDQAIQHYSCFISYSTMDQDFAERLHADLQDKGVRCWCAPHDLPIVGKILDEIDAAIRLRDRVLLILSEHSIKSDWVEDEVTKGFEEERRRGQIVLFPVRLDQTVMKTNEAWAAKLRARNIGDFGRWKDHDAYKRSFERVVRDLTITP